MYSQMQEHNLGRITIGLNRKIVKPRACLEYFVVTSIYIVLRSPEAFSSPALGGRHEQKFVHLEVSAMDLFHNSVRLVIFLCVQISFLGLAFV